MLLNLRKSVSKHFKQKAKKQFCRAAFFCGIILGFPKGFRDFRPGLLIPQPKRNNELTLTVVQITLRYQIRVVDKIGVFPLCEAVPKINEVS